MSATRALELFSKGRAECSVMESSGFVDGSRHAVELRLGESDLAAEGN